MKMKILVIDDAADQAGINTKKIVSASEEQERNRINSLRLRGRNTENWQKSRLLCWFSLEIVSRSNKRAYLILRVSSNLFMEFPKAISMQEVLKSGFRHIL